LRYAGFRVGSGSPPYVIGTVTVVIGIRAVLIGIGNKKGHRIAPAALVLMRCQ
jgi:hypothetical protein